MPHMKSDGRPKCFPSSEVLLYSQTAITIILSRPTPSHDDKLFRKAFPSRPTKCTRSWGNCYFQLQSAIKSTSTSTEYEGGKVRTYAQNIIVARIDPHQGLALICTEHAQIPYTGGRAHATVRRYICQHNTHYFIHYDCPYSECTECEANINSSHDHTVKIMFQWEFKALHSARKWPERRQIVVSARLQVIMWMGPMHIQWWFVSLYL